MIKTFTDIVHTEFILYVLYKNITKNILFCFSFSFVHL
ncbi:hypothetical protein [Orthopoxvirus akhmetapox]|uniref:Uncharacterized protein n=1 Tax=Orthopoxvirus akhmetapox TaxID=2200830 RepID=A0A346FT48_9POXV|nr:hypothetical protein AKMV-Vani-004 [Akhmeta virus]AXN75441.1 hypothetical protein AKMV-Vani-217 [Akhmeta virus]QEQ49554.1 hypothetical protein [Akhmeta virus]QEQ49760.1 hypothetical protein [Akhmeta virus]QEQ49767.1 hypothetical protein [Akhmeta virus]